MITTNAESDDGRNGFGDTVSSPDNYGLTQTPRGCRSRRGILEEEKKEEAEEKEKEELVKDGVGEVVPTASEGLVAEEEKKEEEVEEEKEPAEDGADEGPVVVVVEEADGSSGDTEGGDAEGGDAEGGDAEGEDAEGVDAKKSCWTALFCCKIFRK